MEETSKHGVLGRHQPCSQERIEVLSDTIERHHSSRNTPSLLYPESCSDGNLKHDWMKELGSEVARQPEGEVARQAKSFQLTQLNPNPNHDRTGRPVVCSERTPRSQEIDTCFSRGSKNSILEEDANHYRTELPVVWSQRASQTRFSRESKNVILEEDANHDGTGRPVVCSQSERSMLNEVYIDFRISRLPHSVVKQAENSRVRELVKQIENHPHRQALQADLQQSNAYNPFCEKSKKMIEDMGNVELFELFETDPKPQCKKCLLYWSQGIACCTCGQLLKESEASRGAIQCTFDLLSIQNCVIKKGRLHGHRYGKTKEQRDFQIAHNLRKRCIERHFEGIYDRFLKDPEFRESQHEHDRTEEVCIQMDEIVQKDFSYHMTQAEYFRYRKNRWISLNNSGKTRNGERSF